MNIPDAGSLSLGAALLAGLAGSGHCLSMCGGIAGALAMRSSASGRTGSRLALAVAYNVARVASYMLAGALAGLLGRTLLRAVDVAPLSIALRVLAWPDAFAASDIGVCKALGTRNAAEVHARAEAWRPWRAYALMSLWQTLEQPT